MKLILNYLIITSDINNDDINMNNDEVNPKLLNYYK